MTAAEVNQHYVLEWTNEPGRRELVARIYKGTRRTTAFVPVPAGEWDGNVPIEIWVKAQDKYKEDDAKAF